MLVIKSKRLSNVIQKMDITGIPCDSLHAWLLTRKQLIAMDFHFKCTTVCQASDSMMTDIKL